MRLVLIALLALATSAAAQELTCSVTKVERKVEVQKNEGAWQAAAVGLALSAGDRLHTGYKATATVKFVDGSTMEVKPMSLVLIQKLDDGTGKAKSRVWLRLGEVSAEVNKRNVAASDFQVRTPTTTASVRGTQILRIAYNPGIGTIIEMGSHGLLDVNTAKGHAATGAFDQSKVDDDNAAPLRPEDVVRSDIAVHLPPQGSTRDEIRDVLDLGVPKSGPPAESGSGFTSNITLLEQQSIAPLPPPPPAPPARVIVNIPALP